MNPTRILTKQLFLCLAAVVMLFAAQAHAAHVTDQTGRTISVPDNPQRIISLMPSLTEMVFELGQGEKIVGVTQYSKRPPAALKLPIVGAYKTPSIERIVSLQPDLCIALKDGTPQAVVDRIEELGVPVYGLNPTTLEGIMDAVTRLGSLLHAKAKATELVGMMHKQLQEVDARVRNSAHRPRVFFQIDGGSIVSAGPKSFIGRLIARAGGTNLASGDRLYPRYSWEEVIAMQPEVVIISSMSGGFSDEQLRAQWQRWHQLPAIRNNRLFVVDADLFDRPTVRSFDCLEKLVDMFKKQEPDSKRNKNGMVSQN